MSNDCHINMVKKNLPNLNNMGIVNNLLVNFLSKESISFSISTAFNCGYHSEEILMDTPMTLFNKDLITLQVLIMLYNLQILDLYPEGNLEMGFRGRKSSPNYMVFTINNIGIFYRNDFELVLDIEKTKLKRSLNNLVYYVSDFKFNNDYLNYLLSEYKEYSVIQALVIHSIKHNYINLGIKDCKYTNNDIILYDPKNFLHIFYEDEDCKLISGIIVDKGTDSSLLCYSIDNGSFSMILSTDIRGVPINFTGIPDNNQIIKMV